MLSSSLVQRSMVAPDLHPCTVVLCRIRSADSFSGKDKVSTCSGNCPCRLARLLIVLYIVEWHLKVNDQSNRKPQEHKRYGYRSATDIHINHYAEVQFSSLIWLCKLIQVFSGLCYKRISSFDNAKSNDFPFKAFFSWAQLMKRDFWKHLGVFTIESKIKASFWINCRQHWRHTSEQGVLCTNSPRSRWGSRLRHRWRAGTPLTSQLPWKWLSYVGCQSNTFHVHCRDGAPKEWLHSCSHSFLALEKTVPCRLIGMLLLFKSTFPFLFVFPGSNGSIHVYSPS